LTTRFAWKDPGGLGLLLAGVFATRPRAGEDGQGDKRAVFTAASHAQKAVDYLGGLQKPQDAAGQAA
jgi:hypothetical protein